MNTGMVTLINNIKIFRAIIKSITIDVVNFFALIKESTQVLFHYKSVFGDRLVRTSNIAISLPFAIGISCYSTFVSRIIRTRIYSRFFSPFSIAGSATSLLVGKMRGRNFNRSLAY